jgi:O-antigen ligase
MIRLTLLWLFILALGVYAWRDWYTSICGAVLLMAVIQHPDMPKSVLDIQGLNPWNLLLAMILPAWIASRRREGLRWDLPALVTVLGVLYMAAIVIAGVRLVSEPLVVGGRPVTGAAGYLISDFLINSLKWVIPGLLIFDGCRSRPRLLLGVGAVLAAYFLLGLQVIKAMPLAAGLGGAELEHRAYRILMREVGYHRVNLSMMLAAGGWMIVAARPLVSGRLARTLMLGAPLVMLYAQALTAGRAGYVTWVVVGLLLCAIAWRKYLLLVPIVAPLGVLAILTFMPGVAERMLWGFGTDKVQGGLVLESDLDEYTLLAGRNLAWELVIPKILEQPLVGYGRLGMVRTGAWEALGEEGFGHPHNAYLEILLDGGVIGALLVLPFYVVVMAWSISLFRDRRSPVFGAVGGMTCAVTLALLVAAMGSQTFYPREGALAMWATFGLMFRVWLERQRAVAWTRAQAAESWRAQAVGRVGGLWLLPRAPAAGSGRLAPVVKAADIDAALWLRPKTGERRVATVRA